MLTLLDGLGQYLTRTLSVLDPLIFMLVGGFPVVTCIDTFPTLHIYTHS